MARCLNEGRPGVSDGVVGQRAGTAGLSSFEKARRSDEAAPAGRTRLRSDDLHPRRFSSSGSPSILWHPHLPQRKENPVSAQGEGMRVLKRQTGGSWKFALVGLK